MISHPIIRRELLGMLRTSWALAAMVVLTGLLALGVVARWPSAGRVDLAGTQAQAVLKVFGYGLAVGLIFLAPVFPATSIVRERAQGTLALLLNSPISPLSITLGKLVGAVGFVLLLLILSLPAAAACFAMGGVYLAQVAQIYLVLVLLAVSYATLGLLVSSFASTTDSAMRLTYGAILLLALGSMAPAAMLGTSGAALLSGFGPLAPTVVEWLRCVSPLPALMEVLGDADVTGDGVMARRGAPARFAVLAVGLTLGCAAWTAWRMSRRLLDRPRAAGKITDERSAGVQRFRRIMYLWFFDPQRRSGMIGPLSNPVMVKEQRCRRFGRGNWMMRLILGCMVVSLLLMLATATQAQQQAGQLGRLGGVMVLLQMALVILITPSLAGGLIASEVEGRSWPLLQMTPLSAGRIVFGKLMSVAVTLVLILLATIPGYVVLLAIDPHQLSVVIQVVASLGLTAVLCLMVSAAASSCFPSTAVATAVAYVLLLGLCAGTLLLWLGEGAPFGHGLVASVLTVNPLAAALNLIDAPGFEQSRYQLVPIHWWLSGAMSTAAGAILMFSTWRLTRPR